jgi:hypothetical protein
VIGVFIDLWTFKFGFRLTGEQKISKPLYRAALGKGRIISRDLRLFSAY